MTEKEIMRTDTRLPEPSKLSEEDEALLASFGKPPVLKDRYSMEDLREIVDTLRGDHGCDWDKAQTHESLQKYLLEETNEVLRAEEKGDDRNFCEELGDLLLQIVLNARIAEEEGRFTLDDVITGISRKMLRRHPHVFSEHPRKITQEENDRLWAILKAQEKKKL